MSQPEPEIPEDQLFPSRTEDGIIYRLVRPSDTAALDALVLDEFCSRMPLYREAGATTRADLEITLAYLPELTGQPHSLVAEDAATGRLVGARLSALERREEPPQRHPLMVDASLQAQYPRETAVMKCVAALLDTGDYLTAYPSVRLALVSRMLAVAESHARRGIGRRLMQLSAEELAPRLGAQLVVGLTQSFYSQRIFEKLGFHRVHAIGIPDFVDPDTGEQPFKALAETVHQEAVLFAKPV